MEPSSFNGFGSNTYWNRPTSRGRSNRPSRSPSPAYRQSNDRFAPRAKALTRSISSSTATVKPSPVFNTEFNTEHGDVKVTADPSLNLQRSPGVSRSPPDTTLHQYMHDLHAAYDVKDDKAMVKLMKSALPQFSNEHDWEMAAFELTLVLDRVWPHKQVLDISEYLKTTYPHYDRDDLLCPYTGSKKDSFAKLDPLWTLPLKPL
jgi:hypothetical protein